MKERKKEKAKWAQYDQKEAGTEDAELNQLPNMQWLPLWMNPGTVINQCSKNTSRIFLSCFW